MFESKVNFWHLVPVHQILTALTELSQSVPEIEFQYYQCLSLLASQKRQYWDKEQNAASLC